MASINWTLQELSLKNFKKLPIYKLISNTGPRHKPSFKVGVKLPNTKYFFGLGKSKKDAEQNAAIECLKDIGEQKEEKIKILKLKKRK